MCLGEPDNESEDARWGTAAHWLAEQMLQTFRQRVDCDGVTAGMALIDSPAPNGVIVNNDMFDAALTYYNVIVKVVGTDVHRKAMLNVEKRVGAASLDPDAWGTSDAMFYDDTTNTLHVWDLKTGHRSVSAYENRQLVGYGQAACESIRGLEQVNPRLKLMIVQPRCYDGQGPVRSWTTTFTDLRALVNDLRYGIDCHHAGTAVVRAGDWCEYCPAIYKCPAVRDAAAHAADLSMAPVPHNPSDIALAYELEVLEAAESRLKDRKAALEAVMEARIREGAMIPGWRMTDRIGHNAWTQDPIEMGDLFGVDLRADEKPCTPAEAIRRLKKIGLDETVISAYYGKPKIGVKLVRDDISRAAQIFSSGEL